MKVSEPFRVRIEDLRLKPNVPNGMNGYVLMGLVPLLKGSTEDHEPIVVRPAPCCEKCWEVQDGRHRFFASVIAGRPDVLVVEELDYVEPRP